MLATDSGFLNTRDVIILPSDPLSMSLRLIDAFGQSINLINTEIRWRMVSRGTGMRMAATRTDAAPIGTPNANPLSLTVLDSPTGLISLNCVGDVLNDPRGYDYAVDLKPMADDVSAYRAVAKGTIQIFNQPWVV